MADTTPGGTAGFTPSGLPSKNHATPGRGGEQSPSSARGAERVGDKGEVAGEQKLGVGGTAPAPERLEKDAAGKEPGAGVGTGAKVAGVAAAVPAAAVGAQLAVVMMFVNWLKGLVATLMAAAVNLWNFAMGALLAIGKSVMGVVMSIGGAVSSAVGGAVSAVAAGVTTAIAGALTVAVVAVTGVTMWAGGDLALRDARLANCQVEVTRALAGLPGADETVNLKTKANARIVYSVLSAWGMPDENVAGILGNWDDESGIDPTAVQDIFGSPHVMNEQKLADAENTDKGIGLGQWTYTRNTNLRAYADKLGKDWWTLEVQLGFMISAKEGENADVIRDMIKDSKGTPAEAARFFHDRWERSDDDAAQLATRGENATKWMGLFGGWTVNQALADSILAQAETSVDGANTGRAASLRSDCRQVGFGQVAAKEGGLTLQEAEVFMAEYLATGKTFLDGRYPGASGPGSCGVNDKSDNCVGFSTYFVNKYTSFQEYPMGNGIQTASAIAERTGKTLSHTPTVYSVASGPTRWPEGHTFVVLGIEGDQAVIGEAQCGSHHEYTRAKYMPLAELTDGTWEFVDVSDLMLDNPKSS